MSSPDDPFRGPADEQASTDSGDPFRVPDIDAHRKPSSLDDDLERIRGYWRVFAPTYWIGVATLIILVGIPVLIVSAVFGVLLLYRFWAIVYRHNKDVSPGAAVGFSFIPFYNFYWIFIAYGRLAQRYNAYLQNRGLPGKPASYGLCVAYGVLFIILNLPYLGLLALIPGIIIYFLIMRRFKNLALEIGEDLLGGGGGEELCAWGWVQDFLARPVEGRSLLENLEANDPAGSAFPDPDDSPDQSP